MTQRRDGVFLCPFVVGVANKLLITTDRDFFVKHSEDEAREARYLHRTWRKPDGGFYVGIDPPAGAKAEGIVSILGNGGGNA